MKFENTEVFNFEGAIRGMRNPKESWDKSDSHFGCENGECCGKTCLASACDDFFKQYTIGDNDLKLMQTLINAGPEHRKFMRQIFVSVDITAPNYFWAEFDTYKIGTVANSTSFMHKGTAKPFTIDDFEVDEPIKSILTEPKQKEKPQLIYPYETEEYKVYVGNNGREYEVYKNGRIFSREYSYVDSWGTGRKRSFPRKEIIPYVDKSGYCQVNIASGEVWLLHRLVATLWLDNPTNLKTVDHLNGIKTNNSIENLEWVSIQENVKREWETGLSKETHSLRSNYKRWKTVSKLTPPEKLQIKKLVREGKTQTEVAHQFGISQGHIHSILNNDCNSTSENSELFSYCWYWEKIIKCLNFLRNRYLETQDIQYFRALRQILPMGYLYKRTVTMNYENLLSMCSKSQRRFHKLTEWSKSFIDWARDLPYAQELIFIDEVTSKGE